MRPGHFILIDPDKGVLKRASAYPGDRERNERVKRELLRGAGEGCFVDFVPDAPED